MEQIGDNMDKTNIAEIISIIYLNICYNIY